MPYMKASEGCQSCAAVDFDLFQLAKDTFFALFSLSTAAFYALHLTSLFFLLVSLFVFFDVMTVK